MKNVSWLLPVLAAPVVIPSPAYAVTYLTVEEAQQALFPSASEFRRLDVALRADQKRAIEKSSGIKVRNTEPAVWRVSSAAGPLGWFVVDQVLGKHEYITYAVAINANGAVSGVEIMEYLETRGGEVRDARWRSQFLGKGAGAPLKLGDDIANISGATLSSKHITEGVRRLIATFELVLK